MQMSSLLSKYEVIYLVYIVINKSTFSTVLNLITLNRHSKTGVAFNCKNGHLGKQHLLLMPLLEFIASVDIRHKKD